MLASDPGQQKLVLGNAINLVGRVQAAITGSAIFSALSRIAMQTAAGIVTHQVGN
jgi:hypothetical protein